MTPTQLKVKEILRTYGPVKFPDLKRRVNEMSSKRMTSGELSSVLTCLKSGGHAERTYQGWRVVKFKDAELGLPPPPTIVLEEGRRYR